MHFETSKRLHALCSDSQHPPWSRQVASSSPPSSISFFMGAAWQQRNPSQGCWDGRSHCFVLSSFLLLCPSCFVLWLKVPCDCSCHWDLFAQHLAQLQSWLKMRALWGSLLPCHKCTWSEVGSIIWAWERRGEFCVSFAPNLTRWLVAGWHSPVGYDGDALCCPVCSVSELLPFWDLQPLGLSVSHHKLIGRGKGECLSCFNPLIPSLSCVSTAQSPTAADPLQQAYAGVQQYAGR